MGRRSKALKTFAAVALVAWLCASALGQARGDVSTSPFNPAPYRVGERLTYTVSFSNFPTAAHVVLTTAARGQSYGREGVELRAHVETIGVVSAALYAINNDYVTYVEPATGLPYHTLQRIREGGRAEDAAREFNLYGTFDLLSALYRVRALPLAPGSTFAIPVRHGETVYNADVRVTGRELVKTNVGSSNALVAQVRVRGNKRADDYRVHVYLTDDERHVPVLITARHSAGEIRVELASTELLTEIPPGGAMVPPGTPQQPGTTLPPGTQPGAVAPSAPPAGTTGTPGGVAAGAAPAELPFKPGEQLNFNFYLGNTPQPVGVASFHVRQRARYFNREGLLLTTTLSTAGAGQTLFPVNDEINSYVDAATLLPFRSELNLREGKRTAQWVVSADQNGGSALFNDGTRVEMPVGTHDLLSVFYAIRSFDLSVGKRTAVSLLVNKRPRLLFVTSLRRETIRLGGQQIPAVELALATGEAEFDAYNLRLWVSSDSRRLPLRLTATTPLGPVRADLAIIPTALQ